MSIQLKNPNAPATSKQLGFIAKLVTEGGYAWPDPDMPTGTMQEASDAIGALLQLQQKANKAKHDAKASRNMAITASEECPIGLHVVGIDVFKVQAPKGHPERRYAKILNVGPDGVGHFDYTPGLIAKHGLCVDTKATYEQACDYGLKHQRCMCCGYKLDDPVSLVRGIGPSCEKNNFPAAPKRTAAVKREAVKTLEAKGVVI